MQLSKAQRGAEETKEEQKKQREDMK